MSTTRVSADSDIGAPVERVYRVLSNYRDHHPKVLPAAFSNFTVEGGVDAGAVMHFDMTLKVLAPRLLGPIYREELQNIDRYARELGHN